MNISINEPILGKEEIYEVHKTLKNGILTSSSKEGGKNVQEFQNLARSFLKSKYTVAVNSGTSALQAALYACDIKNGDEVLVPSFTFVATVNAVYSVGAKPIFVDIFKDNFTIDTKDIQKKITKKTKAIIPVHLYGNIAYIEEIQEISKKNQLRVIEDSCQSLGSRFKGKHSGTFSDIGCFSMYPAKVMTSGEGGLNTTNNKKLYEKLLMIRNHGMEKGYNTKTFGLNFRLTEINAAIAKVQIKKLPKFLKMRKRNATLLSKLISELKIKIPKERKDESVNWYLYTIAHPKRNKIIKKLNSLGIGATVYYPTPIHKTPFYKKKFNLPVTDWAASNVLSLPIHPNVTSQDIEFIAKSLKSALNE